MLPIMYIKPMMMRGITGGIVWKDNSVNNIMLLDFLVDAGLRELVQLALFPPSRVRVESGKIIQQKVRWEVFSARPCSHFEVGLPQFRTFHPGGDEPVHLHCAALTAPLPGDAYAVPGALSCTLDSLPHLHWPAVPQHGRWWRGPREGGVCPGCFVIVLAGVSGIIDCEYFVWQT